MIPQTRRQELLFLLYVGRRTLYSDPTYSRTQQAGHESLGKKSQPCQRDVRKSLIKDFQRQTLFHKVRVDKENQEPRPHCFQTQYKYCEALKSGKRLVSFQQKPVKSSLVPGPLQRKNILLPQGPSDFHLKAAAFEFLNGNVVIVGRGH